MFKQLLITDGTIAVNLLNSRTGFCLQPGGWRPQITTLKGGGIWAGAPMSEGRRLRAGGEGNVTETFALDVRGFEPDTLVRETQQLRRLLRSGQEAWMTDWATSFVWIIAQGANETYPRYALVMDYRTPEDDEAYFWNKMLAAEMDDFPLIIEREPFWRADEPGTGTVTAISATETYDGRTLGNVDDTGTRVPTTNVDEVFVASKDNMANISDIYINGAGANLMGVGLPYDLLPNPVNQFDYVSFGCDTTDADSGPFCSLVFDIGTAGAGYTGHWEYSQGGAGWNTLTVQDNTDTDGAMIGRAFDTTGVRSVHWQHPSDWATETVNLITGYWVRYWIDTVPGPLTTPAQRNRDVYSVTWGYYEIQAAAVAGDVAALARAAYVSQSDQGTAGPVTAAHRLVGGLRSTSRGTNFNAYINMANEQNHANILVTGTFGAAMQSSPTGWCAQVNNAPAGGTTTPTIRILHSLSTEYHGSFHAFASADQTSGSAGDVSTELRLYLGSSANIIWTSDRVTFQSTTLELLDFGKVDIDANLCEEANEIGFSFRSYGDGAADFELYELILIPVDEWATDAQDWIFNTVGRTAIGSRGIASRRYYLDVDGVYCLKKVGTYLKLNANDRFVSQWVPIMSGHPFYQTNSRQRLWIMAANWNSANSIWQTKYDTVFTVRAAHNQQYYSMRGNR